MKLSPMFCLLFVLPLFGVGCSAPDAGNSPPISKSTAYDQSPVPRVQPIVVNEVFERKEQCAKYLQQAQGIVDKYNNTFSGYNDLSNGKHSTGHSMLEKTCFSKAKNSCFALITERDRVYPDGYDNEMFVIADLLSGERTNVSKTIFSDDDSAVRTEKIVTFSSAKDVLLKSVDCLY